MIFGIGLTVVGYSVFYWGLHHFPGIDGGKRYSLFELLGVPSTWGLWGLNQPPPQIGLTPGGALAELTSDTNTTQSQNAENTTTTSALTGNNNSWIGGILAGIGAPSSANNQAKLNAWNACEGNLSGHSGLGINNPFNTTLNCCGAVGSVNSVGVKSYPTLSAGVAATVQTLQGGQYSAIVQNLQSDGSTSAFAAAVGSSPWGTSGSCIASQLGTR